MCECGAPYHEGDEVRLAGETGAATQAVADRQKMTTFKVTGYSSDQGIVEVQATDPDGKTLVVQIHQDEVVRLDTNDD